MMRRSMLAAIFLFALAAFAHAQVQVSAQVNRSYFLLYERVDLIVTLTNIGDTNLELNNDEGRPWLSFEVSSEGMQHVFLPVHSERQSNFAALALKQGETKTLRVNITPLFAFRDEGNYRAAAVIDLPGAGEIISDPVAFSIQRGHTVVTQLRTVDTLERIYSLVRFSADSDRTELYLRVEAPSENVVYSNVGLGELVSAVDPEMQFDPQGNVHVLQSSSLGLYLYTRADPDGKVIDQRLFKGIPDQSRPRLAKIEDGGVIVQGGLEENTAGRERLSDTQRGKKVDGPEAPDFRRPTDVRMTQPLGASDNTAPAPVSPADTAAPAAGTDAATPPAGDPGATAHPAPSPGP